MNTYDEQTLIDLIADLRRAGGLTDEAIAIEVYDHAFNHFNPGNKADVDIVLGNVRPPIAILPDGDSRLPKKV